MTQKHLWHFLLIVFVLVWSIVAMTPITNRDLLKDFQEKARSKDEAYSNIVNLRTLYPDVYSSDGGFYDAVNPMTGSIGHRRLVLDQSMIMAALDNAITHGSMQRHFATDPVARIGLLYLAHEKMSIR